MISDLIEFCGGIEHDRWVHWQKYLHSKLIHENGKIYMDKKDFERWQKQINTHYVDLTEKEKEFDRKEAIKYLRAISTALFSMMLNAGIK